MQPLTFPPWIKSEDIYTVRPELGAAAYFLVLEVIPADIDDCYQDGCKIKYVKLTDTKIGLYHTTNFRSKSDFDLFFLILTKISF